jgi:carbamoyl-phosphate synthase small subunit
VVTTDKSYPGPRPSGSWAKATASRSPKFKVVAYDFGVKKNILRMLAERGCK